MRASEYLLATVKETPSDAETAQPPTNDSCGPYPQNWQQGSIYGYL